MKVSDQMVASTEKEEEDRLFLSTGCTELNLACTDNATMGYEAGTIVNVVGPSGSGKTIKCLTTFAEAANDICFDDYALILDDAEWRNKFKIAKLFGNKLAERLQPPAYDSDGDPMNSKTVEDFGYHAKKAMDKGPCIYVLDSLDSISSEDELKLMEEDHKAKEKGKQPAGTYGMERAKASSKFFRVLCDQIAQTGSIFIIISQIRSKVGAMAFQKKETRSGGKALEFYCTHIMWLSRVESIKRTVRKRARKVGIKTKCAVTKNSVTGKERDAYFYAMNNYGVDDIRGNVEWLIEEGEWTKVKGGIKTELFEDSMAKSDLIQAIEEEDAEDEVKGLMQEAWDEIEESLKEDRKSRYS